MSNELFDKLTDDIHGCDGWDDVIALLHEQWDGDENHEVIIDIIEKSLPKDRTQLLYASDTHVHIVWLTKLLFEAKQNYPEKEAETVKFVQRILRKV